MKYAALLCFATLLLVASFRMHLMFSAPVYGQEEDTRQRSIDSGKSVSEWNNSEQSKLVHTEWNRLINDAEAAEFASAADQFVGFVRGKWNVKIPKWWRNVLASGWLGHDRTVGFLDSKRLKAVVKRWRKNGGVYVSGCSEVVIAGDNISIRFQDESVSLPLAVLRYGQNEADQKAFDIDAELGEGLVVCKTGQLLFLIAGTPVHDPGLGEELVCFDLASGLVKWRKPLLDGLSFGSYSGLYTGSFVQIDAESDKVLVWLAHDVSVSVQVVSIVDGSSIASFCTLVNID